MADVEIPDGLVEVFVRARAAEAAGADVDAYVAMLRGGPGWGHLRAGLAAVAAHLRVQVCEEIAQACEKARDEAPMTPGWFAYDHAAGIARLHRMPDCGDEYHGADGGPCPGCGFDVTAEPAESPAAAPAPPDPPRRYANGPLRPVQRAGRARRRQ